MIVLDKFRGGRELVPGRELVHHHYSTLDRVSVPSPIAIDILMVRNGEGQSSHVLVFCVNFERHISTHITTSIECYLNSLTDVYVQFINI